MLPWNRSSTPRGVVEESTNGASSTSSSSPLPHSSHPSSSSASSPTTTGSIPTSTPTFLSQHHRKSSSNNSTSILRRATKPNIDSIEAQAMARDNDPWQDNSDDEETVKALQKVSLSNPLALNSGSGNAGGASGGTAVAGGGGGWSFNPFSIVAGRTAPSSATIPNNTLASPTRAGPDDVAAALNNVGRGRPPQPSSSAAATTSSSSSTLLTPTSPNVPQRSVSYLATANKIQEEADKQVDEEEKERRGSGVASRRESLGKIELTASEGRAVEEEIVDSPVEETQEDETARATKSPMTRIEQCRHAIRPDVDEIVKDPVSVLTRLTEPAPPASASSTSHHRDSTSSTGDSSQLPTPKIGGINNEEDDDDDDDPAKGYIQLDATNYSSGGPQIVEFLKEEDPEESAERTREKRRRRKFVECLGAEAVDLAALRTLAWAGIPPDLRPMAWQLLMGYLPAPSARRVSTLARKRQEYADAVRLAFSRGVKGLDGPIWHQISIDVPRTNPGTQLWQCEGTQRSLERVLYVWAIRHPASGYVQGINDLVTPFFQVFLSAYIDSDPETYDVAALPPAVLEALEADSFWCLSKLLDGIQDNYIFAQPGITRQVARMKELCSRVDAPLAHHLEENSVEFIQFAFRWMNCLLMREMSVKNIIRMWDTYLAEGQDAFSEFHLYVCLAFLVRWSDQLREMDFQSIIMFLQRLPTQGWTDQNTELLLSEAFMWSRTFVAR